MKYRYKFTNKAKEDLEGIFEYISVELANNIAAKNLMDEIEKSIKQICEFPEMFPLVNNEYLPKIGVRKKVIKNYVMYYLCNKQTKTNIIIRIVYAGRNMNEIFKNL